MKSLRKKIYAAAGYTTLFLGPGRREFNPKSLPPYESYLKETAQGTLAALPNPHVEEGVIASFMAARFLKQANLPAFLPFMVPALLGKPCIGVEGACGSGGRAIGVAARSLLSDSSDAVFVAGFEMQNSVKAVYGADILAGAGYYSEQRKSGEAHFFPGLFSMRAGAYYEQYGYDLARQAMAKWYELAISNARRNPKAQEYHNNLADPYQTALAKPSAERFVAHLNLYDCSKVTDGAASLMLFTEEGLQRSGVKKEDAIEIVAIGEAEGDITKTPEDPTELATTKRAVQKALEMAHLQIGDISLIELHDCFSITALLTIEALGLAKKGKGAEFILSGKNQPNGEVPTNPSGGLCGFGHPTGASGVRQLVDLQKQLTGKAENQLQLRTPYALMISMGGDDKTVSAIIAKAVTSNAK
jgi:acetyl-CoA C-acetyltransferase/acetyl-CoA acyltransferase